jgi:ribosome-associated protein
VPAADESIATALAALAAADDKKALAPALLDVADVLGIVDLFAIVQGTSERHVDALADEVEQVLKHDHGRPVLRREGSPASGWVILDYGDVVVHLFRPEQRETYDLERLWRDVPRLDPVTGEVIDPGTPRAVEQRDDLLVEG